MSQTIRVSLPGYDALSESNIFNYSVYADSDNILIKEFNRGTMSLSSGETNSAFHGFGYIPFVLAFGRQTSGTVTDWTLLMSGGSESGLLYVEVDTDLVYFTKTPNGNTGEVAYYIFYDQQV